MEDGLKRVSIKSVFNIVEVFINEIKCIYIQYRKCVTLQKLYVKWDIIPSQS
jgi:hypothetical protein